jgi:Trk-type K+ transport system membrane component
LREKDYLKQRYAGIISSVGMILLLSSALMLTPLLILISHPVEIDHAWAFGLPAACLFVVGIALWKAFRSPLNITLTVQEGGIIVLLSWIVVILFSAWPFTAALGLPYSRAIFESVSKWTTTGLSVVDVTNAGKMILIWRSIIQLAGGAGLAIIMMSAIVGPTGVGISSAGGRSDQLVPHVRQSARLVLIICVCYAVAGIMAYWMAGMSFFDAVNHSFAAVSTGGFSTRVESIGYWNSTAIEAVTLPLMLLGNWNAFGLFLLIILMLIGGGTCSTAGGIKQFRIYLLWKMLCWDIRRYLMPRTAILEHPIWEGNKRVFVDDARIRQATVFIFLYLVAYMFGVMILCACGFNLVDSLFEFASAIGTVGLSVGVTTAQMPDAALWSETIAMFLGRLEFIVVIVSLLKVGEDGRRMLARTPRER